MDIKNVIINEDTAKLLKEEYSMTLFKFNSNMKKFLANLLVDPINTDIEDIFKINGFTKNEILKHLLDYKILQKECNIDDEDENGIKQKAKFRIRYKLPKNRLDDKLGMLYDILFPSEELNEDGGGATSCAGVAGDGSGSCGFVQPLFGVVRKSKKNVTEAVTGEDIEASAVTYVYCKDKKGKLHILCGKRIKFPDDEMGGKWNPPMGHLHKGESMIDGAIRECFEESGVKLEKKYIKLISKEDYGNVYKVMLPDTIDKYPPKKGDEENGKFKWLPVEEIGSLDWAWTCGKIAKKLVKKDVLNERKEKQNLLESKMSRKAENLCFNIIDKYYNKFVSLPREDNKPIEIWYDIFFDIFYHTNTMNDWKIIEVAPLFCELFMSNIHSGEDFKKYKQTSDSWNGSNSNLPLIIKMFNYINDIYKPIKLQKDENGNPIPLQPEIQEIQDKRKNIQYELINTLKQYINKQYDLHILQMLLIKHQKQYLKVLKDLDEKQNQILNTNSNNTETQKESDYDVELIDSMEQAWKYGQYSGVFDPEHNRYSGQLCFTNNLNQWENFTNRGENTCYVLLKKGWENIKPPTQEINGVIESIHGNDGYYGAEYTAYDSYGMSMIFVFISPDGNLIRSNGRWNHGFGNKTKHKPGCSVDYEFKKEDIIELLGSDEIFKIGCSAYQSMIDNGKDLSSIFKKIMELPYGYKLGFLSSVFSDTCCNIITPNNKMFIDTNNKNYWLRFNKRITNDLYIVSSSFATYILDFSNGDMDIYLFSLKKLLDKNISLEGICDSVCDLGNGETYIRINNFCNIVNENGDLVFGDDNLINWCFEIFIYTASELCLVRKDYSKNNYYDLETKTVLFGDIKNYNGWLQDISPISNYYHYINVYGWSNIINIKTKTVLFGDIDDIDTWSDSVDKFKNNTYKVLKDGLVTLVLFKDDGECKILTDTDGNVIWGKSIFIEDDLFIIRKNDDEGWGRENYLRLTNDGCIGIFGDINNPETWFREVRRRGSNLFVVREVDSRDNDKFNCFVLTNDGYQLIYGNVYNVDEWFQYLRILDDFIIVTKNYKRNYLVQDNDNGGYKCVSGDINDTNTWFNQIEFDCDWDSLFVEKNNKENYLVPDGNDGYKLVFGDINNTDTWFQSIVSWSQDCFRVSIDDNMYSLLIRDGNGVYKLITNDNDKVLWFKWIKLWEDGDIEVQIDDDNFGYLIPVDKDKGIYRLEKNNEDSQQQNQPLNEIINRLVRNYLR